MNMVVYQSLNDYVKDHLDLLSIHEIENNLIIGNCLRGLDGVVNTNDWFLASVKENDEVKLIVLMTPPFPILIYEVNHVSCDNALDILVEYLHNHQIKVPGIVAEKVVCSRFVEKYRQISGVNVKLDKKMRIYRLDKVKVETDQKLRKATINDMSYLPFWFQSFYDDAELIQKPTLDEIYHKVKHSIELGNVYIYEDKFPVSQVASNRKTLNGAVISAVYTPPYFRSKGYATKCVANFSQLLLEQGYQFCALFTDLNNPVSNSIYQKIGYEPIIDFDEYQFL